MRHNRGKSAWAVALAVAMLCVPLSGAVAESVPGEPLPTEYAEVRGKSEVVYATLGASGDVQSVYAVNHFDIAKPGRVDDYGAYASVVNLTDTSAIHMLDGAQSFAAPEGDFYYQGNLGATELPWAFDISYRLDGREVSPEALAGASGDLEIHIRTSVQRAVDPTFYENYMLQIQITLDGERCARITADGGTIAEAGKNRMIAFTVLPKRDADAVVAAAVRDFRMAGIEISAMPFSMSFDAPDTADMTDRFSELSDAIASLNDGVGELADGVKDVKSGATKLTSGSSDIAGGLRDLSDNAKPIRDGSAQIASALKEIAASMSGGGAMDMGDLTQLPDGLAQLADALERVSGGLSELKSGFVPALAALDEAIDGIPEASVSQEQIAALYAQIDAGQRAVLDALAANYRAAQTVKGTYAQVSPAFEAIGPTIDTLTGSLGEISGALTDMAAQIGGALSGAGADATQQLQKLADGLNTLSDRYGTFHSGLSKYLDGVRKMYSGYADFNAGLARFSDGLGDLKAGVEELHDGTAELDEETSKLPDTLQEEIDTMLEEYTGKDFTPVSFVDARNASVGLVQFVLKTEPIEAKGAGDAGAEASTRTTEEGGKSATVVDRLMDLFR